ncbi:hypothetical protein BKA65DRAFT_542496 [Rhexocercosporidium sp. MPI-PUGE-AT-0058]|nr:hypothetical protein BKA65DRAFT_542496 [Rhexocercosporidium sp. MPI-PUGE-AT-0058]
MLDPSEDPRIRGDDIPKFLYKVDYRVIENSPSSPSVKGFEAASSGMFRTAGNHDAFPTTRDQYDRFFQEYVDLMNNPIEQKLSSHVAFVRLYSTRSLADLEVTLFRESGSMVPYRVYCVRGDKLRQFYCSVVRGRSVFTIGRDEYVETIHASPEVGEEFLVWGRVPVEALMGSWGADGVLQYASGNFTLLFNSGHDLWSNSTSVIVRRAVAVQHGSARHVLYVEIHEETSEEKGFARLDAMGSPSGLSRMQIQPRTSSQPKQAYQTIASAPPPPAPSFNTQGGMMIEPRMVPQAKAYKSPYGPNAQMDGSSDEPNDEKRPPTGQKLNENGRNCPHPNIFGPHARPARSAAVLTLEPSSDDERAAREEEEYRREREGVSRNNPAQGVSNIVQTPAQPPRRTPLPTSRPPRSIERPDTNTAAQAWSNRPLNNPTSVETGTLAPAPAPSSIAPPGPPSVLSQNPSARLDFQITSSAQNSPPLINLNAEFFKSSREGPYQSLYPSVAAPAPTQRQAVTTSTSYPTTPAAKGTAKIPAKVPNEGMNPPAARHGHISTAKRPLGSPSLPSRLPKRSKIQTPSRIRRTLTPEEMTRAIREYREKHYPDSGPDLPEDRSQTPAPTPAERQKVNLGSTQGNKGQSGTQGIPELNRQDAMNSGRTTNHPSRQANSNQALGTVLSFNWAQYRGNVFHMDKSYSGQPPNPLPLHPSWEREGSAERTARETWLNLWYARIQEGYKAKLQQQKEDEQKKKEFEYRKRKLVTHPDSGTANMPIELDHDDEEVEQTPRGSMHHGSETAGRMQNRPQSFFQGPPNPQPYFANLAGQNPYSSRPTMGNPFVPVPPSPQPFSSLGNGRGGVASLMGRGAMMGSSFNTPPPNHPTSTMGRGSMLGRGGMMGPTSNTPHSHPPAGPTPPRSFNSGMGPQNGPSNGLHPQTSQPKPKTKKSKSKSKSKTKVKQVNPFGPYIDSSDDE